MFLIKQIKLFSQIFEIQSNQSTKLFSIFVFLIVSISIYNQQSVKCIVCLNISKLFFSLKWSDDLPRRFQVCRFCSNVGSARGSFFRKSKTGRSERRQELTPVFINISYTAMDLHWKPLNVITLGPS